MRGEKSSAGSERFAPRAHGKASKSRVARDSIWEFSEGLRGVLRSPGAAETSSYTLWRVGDWCPAGKSRHGRVTASRWGPFTLPLVHLRSAGVEEIARGWFACSPPRGGTQEPEPVRPSRPQSSQRAYQEAGQFAGNCAKFAKIFATLDHHVLCATRTGLSWKKIG